MSNLSKWDPFRDLTEFQNRLAGIFGAEGAPITTMGDVDWQPAVDVAEDEDGYIITADLPEVNKEDAHVVVKDGVLTISGERKREKEEEDKKRTYHRVERSFGSYQRTFRLPEGVDPSHIKADFKDGVLTVRMPRGKDPEPEEHRIEVN